MFGVMESMCGLTFAGVNGSALPQTPFCRTCTLPVFDPAATVATICVSVQLVTTPAEVPSHTWPVPCAAPKPEPEIVTCVPPPPTDRFVIVAVGTAKASEFDTVPSRRTCTVPDCEPVDTAATISVSLHETTVPGFVPSQTTADPCAP